MSDTSGVIASTDEIRETILAGLFTDGAHHKQWYLEAVAGLLGIDLLAQPCEAGGHLLSDPECDVYDHHWEPGIPS